MFKKLKLRIASFFCAIGARIYGSISRVWRFLFEHKYKSMPKTIPWKPNQILLFFSGCEWTSDPWDGRIDIISKPEKFFELRRGDCVTVDTEIIVKNRDGHMVIKSMADLRETYSDYLALSYNFDKQKYEWQPIVDWIGKGVQPVYEAKLANGSIVKCTKDHKFFIWRQSKNHLQVLPLKDIPLNKDKKNKRVCIAKQIPCVSNNSYLLHEDKDKQMAEMWLYGIYLAEGWAEKSHVCISNDDQKVIAKIVECCELLGVSYKISKRKTNGYVTIHKSLIKERLKEFGDNSLNKRIPYQIFSCDIELLEILNDAYRIGDAWKPKEDRKSHLNCELIHNTSSNQLAKDLKILYMLFGRPLAPYYQKDHQGVGDNPIWRLYESSGKAYQDKMPGVTNKGLRYKKLIGSQEVCDITVADTHNFILSNGIIAHNCDEFAQFAAAVLDKDVQKHILSVIWYDPLHNKFEGHNVCIFKQGLSWYHIGNWGMYGPFTSLMPLDSKFKTPNGPLVPNIVPAGCQGIYFSIRDPKTLKFLVGGSLLKIRSKK